MQDQTITPPVAPTDATAPTIPTAPVAPVTPVGPSAEISTMSLPNITPPTPSATTDTKPAAQPSSDAPASNDSAKTDKPDDKKSTDTKAPSKAAESDVIKKIAEKIRSSENILVALSKHPTVDDIAAAVGLTLYLDGIQRHVTAIYSGRIIDGLNFLQPEATFENNTDSLQDFIIALGKEKADHLRYKLEGDYVKVFITPYRAKITENDLTFSHGEYNVDFVIALDVANADELDSALGEYNQIMRNASTVNITTNGPGKFGEIDWSNPTASSVCEMVTQLIFELQGDEKPLDKDVATALLTGIVAATDRFSNSRTNSDTLGLASKLMGMGADQQLITANISSNEFSQEEEVPEEPSDNLTVDHAPEEVPDNTPTIVMPTVSPATEAPALDAPTATPEAPAAVPEPEAQSTVPPADATVPPADATVPPADATIPSVDAILPPVQPMTDPLLTTSDPTLSVAGTPAPTIDMATTDLNPAAGIASEIDPTLAFGPAPADMTIPNIPLQPDMMPPQQEIISQPTMTQPDVTQPEIAQPDMSATNAELADRPDVVLPPPPMPPVADAGMMPPTAQM